MKYPALPFLGALALLLTNVFLQAQEPKPTTGKPIRLVVQAQRQQTLLGFGSSLVSSGNLPDGVRAEMFDRVFGQLKMNVLRLWVESGEESDVAAMERSFLRSYPDPRRLLEDARRHGVDTLLLAPA
ncbi:MAG: hypothetical protein ABSH20_27035, partial [Tepidisphaeraceae bacterium]